MPDTSSVSIILPARNEAANLPALLDALRTHFPSTELIVIDDGSGDRTPVVAEERGAKVVSHPYGMGNGAAIKTGARVATGNTLVFMDADGQHSPTDVQRLLAKIDEGYDMVVGARSSQSQASFWRGLANRFYNRLASWVTGHTISDLTSGFRAVDAETFRQFLYLLPNGFSYPTTITMACLRAGYAVSYVPIHAGIRGGKSHLQPLRDGIRFLLIIFRVGTLYSPLKVFVPVSAVFFLLGLAHYLYTYVLAHRFTNMSALLFSMSVLIFLMGLISEQITGLLYSNTR